MGNLPTNRDIEEAKRLLSEAKPVDLPKGKDFVKWILKYNPHLTEEELREMLKID